MFARRFIDIIKQYPAGTVFVDLFGGSGLLSHITKYHHPRARVIYNDFDNYRRRIANIPRTNALLQSIRPIALEFPRKKLITGVARDRIIDVITREECDYGYVDYITLSASLLFSMKYRTSLEALCKEGFYNKTRQTNYPTYSDYLSTHYLLCRPLLDCLGLTSTHTILQRSIYKKAKPPRIAEASPCLF